LGLEAGFSIPDKEFAHLIVKLDEFHEQHMIEFVGYDERIYKYCLGEEKKGGTTHDGNGKMANKTGSPPANARDYGTVPLCGGTHADVIKQLRNLSFKIYTYVCG
jgi:hypothetical protein